MTPSDLIERIEASEGADRLCPYCNSRDVLVEDGGPRNAWRGYTFCGDCGETVGRKWRRMIDDFCERTWGYRPNKTPGALKAREASL